MSLEQGQVQGGRKAGITVDYPPDWPRWLDQQG